MNTIDYEIFDAKVEKFLRHQMTAEEESAFKTELTTSPELMERARTMALMVKEMKTLGAPDKDKEVVDEIKGMSETEFRKAAGLKAKKIALWPRVARYVAAACIVGVICTIGLKLHTSSQYAGLGNTADFYAYTTEFADVSHLRGDGEDELIAILSPLYDNVKSGNELKHTIKELETYYNSAQYEDFEIHLYVDDIAWILAFAYLKDGDGKKAIPVLEEMLERNKDYPAIAKPVQELLENVRDI